MTTKSVKKGVAFVIFLIFLYVGWISWVGVFIINIIRAAFMDKAAWVPWWILVLWLVVLVIMAIIAIKISLKATKKARKTIMDKFNEINKIQKDQWSQFISMYGAVRAALFSCLKKSFPYSTWRMHNLTPVYRQVDSKLNIMIIGLAPMDGFTDYAFRQITKEIFQKYGEKKKYEFMLRTEFMNANGYLINPVGVVKHLLSNKEQAPLIAQIFGNEKKTLVESFVEIEKKYADCFQWLELNLWCPAKTVIQNWWGSAMLKDRKQVLEILKDIKKQTSLSLSIKTRTGITDDDKIQQKDFLIQASKICSMMTIHGRTVKQAYSWDVDRDFMYEIKKNIDKKCLLLWNGWITTYEEIEDKKWNLDGVLIGQAAIGNPRIFTPHVPSRQELKATILRHLELTVRSEQYFEQQEKQWSGVLEMPEAKELPKIQFPVNEAIVVAFRKHLFQYIKWITWSKEWKRTISVIKDYEELVNEIVKFLG